MSDARLANFSVLRRLDPRICADDATNASMAFYLYGDDAEHHAAANEPK
ncbi:hypothetical protein [Neorhizobium tomejilense]|nr:hypothetical protein [Neorhizobium tomejilense]